MAPKFLHQWLVHIYIRPVCPIFHGDFYAKIIVTPRGGGGGGEGGFLNLFIYSLLNSNITRPADALVPNWVLGKPAAFNSVSSHDGLCRRPD